MRLSAAGCVLCLAAACATEAPPKVVARAPAAREPRFVGLWSTSARPSLANGAAAAGELRELKPCTYASDVFPASLKGGLLLRFEAPVPTDLAVALSLPSGAARPQSPDGPEEEADLARRGVPYWYENTALVRGAATGSVAAREVLLWPGAAARLDRRLDLMVSTVSFDPLATGADRESPPLALAVVGQCPDFTLYPGPDDEVVVPAGTTRRVSIEVVPKGDGAGAMRSVVGVAGAVRGMKISLLQGEQSSRNWTDARTAVLVLEADPDAADGATTLQLKAQVGPLERKATLRVKLRGRNNP